MSLLRFRNFLIVLSFLIIGLMALGAGVRTMNAGLSCPDWPLCFGKVIPDFHVGVWFEFVHRAYAGVVAILYAVALFIAFRSKDVPSSTKTAAKWGVLFLTAQIVMGGLTVLLLVKAVVVTTHLLLATLFLSCVAWMLFGVQRAVNESEMKRSVAKIEPQPRWKETLAPFVWILPVLVFLQIAIGGLVASTYSGSVCVDWPLCNGKWVPTWKGAIGLQIVHRFSAYALVVLFLGIAAFAFRKRHVISGQFSQLCYWTGGIVILQTVVGILNLVYFIPPHLTVIHQTLAMALLLVTLKMTFDVRSLESPSAAPETLSRTPEFSRS